MRVEVRKFLQPDGSFVKHLILISESEAQSKLIDEVVGTKVQDSDGLIAAVAGEVRLADGCGEHYIRLVKNP